MDDTLRMLFESFNPQNPQARNTAIHMAMCSNIINNIYEKGGFLLDELKDDYDINVVEDYSKRNFGKSFNNLTPRQQDEILEEYTEDTFDSDEDDDYPLGI